MADVSLSLEFECVICSGELTKPKYIGPCNHTFCKDCIQQLWVSRGRRRTIPCPECRRECPIPRTGVDDLKDNFKLSTIMETYRNQQEKCTTCPNKASSFCHECDFKLCPGCKGQHDLDPYTRSHDPFGLCPSHGNGLIFFCSACKQAVCSRCKVSNHNQGDHDVKPIRPVFGDMMRSIQASSSELEDAIRTRVIEEDEKKLMELRAFVQEKSHFAEVQATADEEETIADKKNEIHGLNTESQRIQEQVDVLLKDKVKVDDKSKQLVEDVEELEKKKTTLIADVGAKFRGSFEDIDQRLQLLDTRRKEMKASLQQGRAVGSAKITIDAECIAYMTNVSQELFDLVKASRESDTKTLIEEVRRSNGELVLHVGDIGQGGEQILGSDRAKQEFKQLTKMSDFRLPSEQDDPFMFVTQIKPTLDNHLATLASLPRYASETDAIFFHDNVSNTFTGKITKGVHPACDMAITSTGELVVARCKAPPIRVFNRATGAYRDINITHGGKAIDKINCVETDELDNMFVSSANLLLVLNSNGNVIAHVTLRYRSINKMAFSSATRVLHLAAKTKILRFKWSNNALQEISSLPHGVEGFACRDVCVGSAGEVLVVGNMANWDIVIYQVTEDETDVVSRQVTSQHIARSVSPPHICIKDNHLWLGHIGVIRKFQLFL